MLLCVVNCVNVYMIMRGVKGKQITYLKGFTQLVEELAHIVIINFIKKRVSSAATFQEAEKLVASSPVRLSRDTFLGTRTMDEMRFLS